jgi:hypothetical protein
LNILCLADQSSLSLWRCPGLNIRQWHSINRFPFDNGRPLALLWLHTQRQVRQLSFTII